MHRMSAGELLSIWEAGRDHSRHAQMIGLLAAVLPDESPASLAELSIGRRDGLLLTIRRELFGSDLEAVANCPNCGEQLEVALTVDELRIDDCADACEHLTVQLDGHVLRFRLPNSADLVAIGELTDLATARSELLQRCLLRADRPDTVGELRLETLPRSDIAAISARMDAADPQANIELAITCPRCTHACQAPFDVAGFLQAEIDEWAHRTLQEVHALASAYAWRETDILAMSAQRRRLYMELLSQ